MTVPVSYPGLIGTFAVVKLWPNAKVAEDEVIARLKRAAQKLGLRCIEIGPDGKRLGAPNDIIGPDDVDFVIHLHFETPKAYDAFSFVALWNPLQFYHDYQPGKYRQYSCNLTTHNDSLSCDSPGADAHLGRMIAGDPTRLPPQFKLYHSLAEPIIAPKPGKRKLFYTGINWEKLGRGRSRHHELLKLLDSTGDLRIHGPRELYGIKVWEDFKSYVGPLPFDGVSVVKEIADAGIVLALSSEAHKDAEMMSNRLFEGLAGGAVIISDENAFVRRYFGDSVLYIDTTLPADETFSEIRRHLRWIRDHEEEALALAARAQAIFKANYTLDASLHALYSGFVERRENLEKIVTPKTSPEVNVFLLLPRYQRRMFESLAAGVAAQTYPNVRYTLLVDRYEYQRHGKLIHAHLSKRGPQVEIRPTDFYKAYTAKKEKSRMKVGKIAFDALQQLEDGALVCFVESDETIFSDHLSSLVASAQEGAACAGLVMKRRNGENTELFAHMRFSLLGKPHIGTTSAARYLFRKPANLAQYEVILPYLDSKAFVFLAFDQEASPTRRVTVVKQSFAQEGAAEQNWAVENEIIMDFIPRHRLIRDMQEDTIELGSFEPAHLSLRNLSDMNKLQLVKDLFSALPLPSALRRFVFFFYRRLRRRKLKKPDDA